MTVSELIEELKKCDQNALVIMTSDPEGNEFNTLDDVDGNSNYNAEEGTTGIAKLTKELEEEGYSEEDMGC